MGEFIIKNNSGDDIIIKDVGLFIEKNETILLTTEEYFFYKLCKSSDINSLVLSSKIIINDLTNDLDPMDALNFLIIQNKFEDGKEEIVSSNISPIPVYDGKPWYNTLDNTLYLWDPYRNKWLSSSSILVTLNRSGNVDNDYLNIGNVSRSDITGAFFNRNSTLIGMSIKSYGGNNNKGGSIEIDYNNILDFFVVNYKYYNNQLNIDLNSDHVLQIYFWSTGSALQDVIAHLEFRWRP
jgi:hypothetical protein